MFQISAVCFSFASLLLARAVSGFPAKPSPFHTTIAPDESPTLTARPRLHKNLHENMNRTQAFSKIVEDAESCDVQSQCSRENHSKHPGNFLSTSPWILIKETNRTRTPKIIHRACCICKKCVQLDDDDGVYKEMPGYLSEPVKINFPFTVTVNSTTTIEHEKINVGCICVKEQYKK
ncbi:interleukin-17D-like [Clavelina lepadiformis]|uniref:interleukin-17D-like n=1 Tax=Clavelina lepadiformis TaxID=159417 RepID=UPI0040411759